MDSTALDRITSYVKDSGHEVDSVSSYGTAILSMRNTSVHRGTRIESITFISCTKSVMGSLVGIAVHQGKIRSLNDKMVDYFPNRTIQNLDERKKSITLLNLMTMKAGFDWAERTYPYTDPRNPMNSGEPQQ